MCVCWTFTLPILVLDIELYFTLEHYSYLWRVCVCAHAGVCMCVCAQVCVYVFGCCFVSGDGLLVDVCQCCCLLMFVCLPLLRHFPCKTWWIKNLNLNKKDAPVPCCILQFTYILPLPNVAFFLFYCLRMLGVKTKQKLPPQKEAKKNVIGTKLPRSIGIKKRKGWVIEWVL